MSFFRIDWKWIVPSSPLRLHLLRFLPFLLFKKMIPPLHVRLTRPIWFRGPAQDTRAGVEWANEFRASGEKIFFCGELVAQRRLQKCSGILDSFHVSSRIASGVDPAGVHSYNRPSVMDGKTSFL
jgi:hypothetical protein